MKFILTGIMKTKHIAQFLGVQLDCMIIVVAIGRKSLHQMNGRWA